MVCRPFIPPVGFKPTTLVYALAMDCSRQYDALNHSATTTRTEKGYLGVLDTRGSSCTRHNNGHSEGHCYMLYLWTAKSILQ